MKKLVAYGLILSLVFSVESLAIQVFIVADKTYVLEVKARDSVKKLRKKIQKKIGFSHDNFYLMLNGLMLHPNSKLADVLVRENSSIFVNFTDDTHNTCDTCRHSRVDLYQMSLIWLS